MNFTKSLKPFSIILGLLILLSFQSNVKAANEKTTKKPNVLILMFDDMRFDTFSYRGGPVSTPNIDALAAHSSRFDYAMSTTGLCSPLAPLFLLAAGDTKQA
ncbi:sulfatase-like hydrolase/transferase [Paraglaciecola aquimarina]|uniref:Sulfatase-like hydrolase/transferase n=1 Tax=Paraglaciecola aquimarina TaxID=1235557 RepID=A0ABU3ST58_9ALTE|nr:sulfatase-like hydrolase/transferase [Paraglaciecola aquimarina]MDU0353167.1 sulfatase-like hydrolase/transferase [Paraglaciecola aquimarina]